MWLFLVQWEEFNGNDHCMLVAADQFNEADARARIVENMRLVDHHFDDEDITVVDISQVTSVDGHSIFVA